MPKHNYHHDVQDLKDPKKPKKKNLTSLSAQLQEKNNQIVNTSIFDLAFASDIPPHRERQAIPDSALEKLGRDCYDWAKSDAEPIKVRPFFRALDYDFDDIERFRNKSPI